MTQYGFYYNTAACTGCKACQMACKNINDLPVGTLYRRVYDMENGSWEASDLIDPPADLFVYHVSLSCNHCEHPACAAVCPSGAMHKDPETGIVSVYEDRCIGCKTCAQACPYDAPRFRYDLGHMGKCDLCAGEIAKGRKPACATICHTRALDFGVYEELVAKYGAGSTDIAPMPDDATGPRIVMIPHPKAPRRDSRDATEISFDFEV